MPLGHNNYVIFLYQRKRADIIAVIMIFTDKMVSLLFGIKYLISISVWQRGSWDVIELLFRLGIFLLSIKIEVQERIGILKCCQISPQMFHSLINAICVKFCLMNNDFCQDHSALKFIEWVIHMISQIGNKEEESKTYQYPHLLESSVR